MDTTTLTWPSENGQSIHVRHWPATKPRAVVCIVHGLGEHIGRYDHVAAFFSKKNIATVGIDLPGFGLSTGKKGHTDSCETYLKEISKLVEKAVAWYANTPVFLYGQSMGGNLVLNFMLKRGKPLAGVIASSPWIRLAVPPSPFLVGFAKVMQHIFPTFTQSNGLDTAELATEPAVAEKYRTDPLVHDRITVKTGLVMLQAAAMLDSFAGEIPAPLLLMHGDADRITDPEGSRALASRIPEKVTFKLWLGLKHELHNEPQKNEILDFVVKWMEGVS